VSEEETHSRNSSITSENWDVCECSWDCSVDPSTSWEKDDRDILDTAKSYVTAASTQVRRSARVKMTVKTAVRSERPDSSLDLLDTSMTPTSGPSMSTIYEDLK